MSAPRAAGETARRPGIDVVRTTLRLSSNYDVSVPGRPPDGDRLLLLPRAGRSLAPLAVGRDVAVLLLDLLRAPGPVADVAHATFGERTSEVIRELVLDGLLEVEHEGAFVSGIDAVEVCRARDGPDLTPRSSIARLSLAALRYAQALDEADAAVLARRLYAYHQYPLSPARARDLVSSLAATMRIDAATSATGALLRRHWLRVAPSPGADVWMCWVPPREACGAPRDDAGPTYKLYVSPDSSVVAAALPAVVAALADAGAPTFKVACGAYGVLRPDKIVVYARGWGDLQGIAAALERALAGLPAHGVPFTAEIAGGGLLSWGVDPPGGYPGARPGAGVSWREWVTAELARYLALGKLSAAPPIEPWRFAAERLSARGVDVQTWAASGTLWPAPRARSVGA